MKDPRLIEIEFLSKLEQERTSTISPWEWSKSLGVSDNFFRDLVFGLFADRCLDGTSSMAPPVGAVTVGDVPWYMRTDPANWGLEHSARSLGNLLRQQSFEVHINHAGRVRLWRLQDEVARARIKDSFGLLWDKRHWDTDLIVRLAMKEPSETAVVLFIDIDDFKAFNTHAGYEVGDSVLRIVFQTVLNCVAGLGEAYRWGGDEIAALLPSTPLEVGRRIGEAIRADVERECGAHPVLMEKGLKTTVSVGAGSFIGRPLPTAVTTAVSELMKTVKINGKNRVIGKVLDLPDA